jgi:hypothetical protein
MVTNIELKWNRDNLQQSAIITLGITVILAILLYFVRWDKSLPEKDTFTYIEVQGITPPPDEMIEEIEKEERRSAQEAMADIGNEKNGGGENEPKVKGTPGPAAGDNNDDPRTPDTKDISENENGDVDDMPTKGNNSRATRMPQNNNPQRPTGNTTQGNAPRRPRLTLGTMDGRGDGTGGNGNVDNGFNSQGNGRGSGDMGNPNGTRGGNANLGSGTLSGKVDFDEDIDEGGYAVYKAYFNRQGDCIRVEVTAQRSVTKSSVLNIGKDKVQQQRVSPDPNGPAERYKTFRVNFKK